MSEYKRGLFTESQKKALEDDDVQFALERIRIEATPFAIHRLHSALTAAGLTEPRTRETFVKTLLRTRRWGGSG